VSLARKDRWLYRSPVAHWAIQSTVNPHTNLYLHANSHHHPSNKQAVLTTLVHRARALCDHESLHDELDFLKDTFKRNGYGYQQIRRALDPAKSLPPRTSPLRSPFFPLSTWLSIASAVCCPGTSSLWAFRRGKLP
jgi:hypothetical protein